MAAPQAGRQARRWYGVIIDARTKDERGGGGRAPPKQTDARGLYRNRRESTNVKRAMKNPCAFMS